MYSRLAGASGWCWRFPISRKGMDPVIPINQRRAEIEPRLVVRHRAYARWGAQAALALFCFRSSDP